jgi:hypothetical protein
MEEIASRFKAAVSVISNQKQLGNPAKAHLMAVT